MFSKNSIAAGLLAGLITPAIAWLIFGLLLQNDAIIMNKPGVPYLIAVGINLIMIRYSFKNDLDKTAKGLMLITFAVLIAVFVIKINISR